MLAERGALRDSTLQRHTRLRLRRLVAPLTGLCRVCPVKTGSACVLLACLQRTPGLYDIQCLHTHFEMIANVAVEQPRARIVGNHVGD
jgi:hypothetical protein